MISSPSSPYSFLYRIFEIWYLVCLLLLKSPCFYPLSLTELRNVCVFPCLQTTHLQPQTHGISGAICFFVCGCGHTQEQEFITIQLTVIQHQIYFSIFLSFLYLFLWQCVTISELLKVLLFETDLPTKYKSASFDRKFGVLDKNVLFSNII